MIRMFFKELFLLGFLSSFPPSESCLHSQSPSYPLCHWIANSMCTVWHTGVFRNVVEGWEICAKHLDNFMCCMFLSTAGFLNASIICFLYITADRNVGYVAVGLDLILGFLELWQFLKMFSVLKTNSIKNGYMWLPVKAWIQYGVVGDIMWDNTGIACQELMWQAAMCWWLRLG